MARRAGGLAFLLLSAAGCAFLAPMPQIAAPAAQMAATQLLLAEIDMTEPYRPEEEPESPANIMIFLTLTFVLAAFILPLLFAGIQSKNAARPSIFYWTQNPHYQHIAKYYGTWVLDSPWAIKWCASLLLPTGYQ